MRLRFPRWRDGQRPITLFAVLTMAFFYAIVVLRNEWGLATAGCGVVVFAVSALLSWRSWLVAQEEVEITTNRTLVIHRRGWSGKSTKSTYALDDFGAIRSYLTAGARRINRLELVTLSGREALLLASRIPAAEAGFWRVTAENLENPELLKLRTELGSRWGFVDHGFQGPKWVGAIIKGSE